MPFPEPNQDPECEVHHYIMGDGRCSCLPKGQVFGQPKAAPLDHLLEILDGIPVSSTPLCVDEGCQQFFRGAHVCFEVLNELPTDPPVRIDYGKPRDLASAAMARGQAELLSKYAAHIEAIPIDPEAKGREVWAHNAYDERQVRAKLAREMSAIYFRAAELEERS